MEVDRNSVQSTGKNNTVKTTEQLLQEKLYRRTKELHRYN